MFRHTNGRVTRSSECAKRWRAKTKICAWGKSSSARYKFRTVHALSNRHFPCRAPLSPHFLPVLRHRAFSSRLFQRLVIAAPRHAATPPESSNFRSVRAHPSVVFYAEIPSDDTRLRIDMLETAHEAARAYDVAACRLRRTHAHINFHDVFTCQQAQDVAPPPRLVIEEDRRVQRNREHRLAIAERGEASMVDWCERFPKDVTIENEWRFPR
ncbi:ethylene-responsive transcription factor crf1 [Hordeum vulgare]|nr:ethylene-responsive transcription factor crf1 [Hordeum vulgare]